MIVGEANPLVGGVHDPALMEAYAVNRAVNSVKNDTEECIEPVADSA